MQEKKKAIKANSIVLQLSLLSENVEKAIENYKSAKVKEIMSG